MPDLLILTSNSENFFRLTELCKKFGFRVKATPDTEIAKGWLKTKPFDALLLDESVSYLQQREIATLLWSLNPEASFIFALFSELSKQYIAEARLLGAEIVQGSKAMADLSELLEKIKTVKIKQKQTALNFLVIEDLDSPRDIICFYVESLGFGSVKGLASAQEALEELDRSSTKNTCIITDIRMPQMSGRELIAAIRSNKKHQNIPIIALTAYGTVDTLVDCLKAGASGFLVKPPKRDDLVREIARAVRIIAKKTSPRLASHNEAEMIRDVLESKGFV